MQTAACFVPRTGPHFVALHRWLWVGLFVQPCISTHALATMVVVSWGQCIAPAAIYCKLVQTVLNYPLPVPVKPAGSTGMNEPTNPKEIENTVQ